MSLWAAASSERLGTFSWSRRPSGVAFLSSTLDYYVRAYDVVDGRQLWQDRLPAGAQATPMTYRSDRTRRQYVVVVAGGHGPLGTKAGDSIVAYALP